MPLALCFHPQASTKKGCAAPAAPSSLKRLLEAHFSLVFPNPPGDPLLVPQGCGHLVLRINPFQMSRAGSQSDLLRRHEG